MVKNNFKRKYENNYLNTAYNDGLKEGKKITAKKYKKELDDLQGAYDIAIEEIVSLRKKLGFYKKKGGENEKRICNNSRY